MNSVWERFFSAAQTLCAAGPIKQRLATAYGKHLANLHGDEVPREIREEFLSLGDNFMSVTPLRGETAVQASVRKMSDQDAATLALRIVNLMGSMVRMQMQPRQPVLRAVNSGDD
jgi:hypothetical protein